MLGRRAQGVDKGNVGSGLAFSFDHTQVYGAKVSSDRKVLPALIEGTASQLLTILEVNFGHLVLLQKLDMNQSQLTTDVTNQAVFTILAGTADKLDGGKSGAGEAHDLIERVLRVKLNFAAVGSTTRQKDCLVRSNLDHSAPKVVLVKLDDLHLIHGGGGSGHETDDLLLGRLKVDVEDVA